MTELFTCLTKATLMAQDQPSIGGKMMIGSGIVGSFPRGKLHRDTECKRQTAPLALPGSNLVAEGVSQGRESLQVTGNARDSIAIFS